MNREIIFVNRPAIGIFRGLSDPKAALRIPIQRDDLFDERFGSDQVKVELRMQVELCGGLLGSSRAALRILQRSEFSGEAKLIHISASTHPGDAAEENGAIMGGIEGSVLMPGNGDKRAIGFGTVRKSPFINPH